jgi:hypothetical protein
MCHKKYFCRLKILYYLCARFNKLSGSCVLSKRLKEHLKRCSFRLENLTTFKDMKFYHHYTVVFLLYSIGQ